MTDQELHALPEQVIRGKIRKLQKLMASQPDNEGVQVCVPWCIEDWANELHRRGISA